MARDPVCGMNVDEKKAMTAPQGTAAAKSEGEAHGIPAEGVIA